MITVHPGLYLKAAYLAPMKMSADDLAGRLGISQATVNGLLAGHEKIDADLAVRLEPVLGRSAQSWLSMQSDYDLSQARSAQSADSR